MDQLTSISSIASEVLCSRLSLSKEPRPTVIEAFQSVKFILNEVNLGWLLRSVHRWCSGIMVLVLMLHRSRVDLTAGFKKPRELTWITGVLLACITLSFGVTVIHFHGIRSDTDTGLVRS